MSISSNRTGAPVQLVEGEHITLEVTPVKLFCADELELIEQELCNLLDPHLPSFIRCNEGEDTEDHFYLPPQTTTPA